MIVYPPSPSGRPCKRTVQWRHTNVQDGLVRTDPDMMSKLVSTEPLHKYYKLDPTPFAKGMFASVWRCRSISSGEVFAAKFSSRYRYGEDCTSEIYHEIALLSLCSPSPKIVKLHDVFQTSKEFIIVMEFAPGGDMQTIIDDNLVPFEKDVVKFIQDVVEGLAYLHHRKIAHLDIKPQNLVMMGDFPDCEIKVCDFEISRVVLDGTEVHEILGTPEYVAPEILHYEPITLAADMWSLGVTTYVLLTGFSPFGGETDQETFLNISRAQVDYPDELFEDVSEDAKDFLKKLLVRNPRERMSSKQALKHPWLVKARKERQQCRSRSRNEARIGCATCPSNNTALKSYLSKSREALFEKVMSQGDLRKKTLIQQYNRTRRMCESQMSLVAREKSLRKETAISRSREKLYGLKSLSKSQEVLSLYKSVLNLNDDIFKLNKDKDLSVNSSNVSVAEEISEREEHESDETRQATPLTDDKLEEGCRKEEDSQEFSYEPSHSPVSTEGVTTSESEISEEEESIKGSESAGDLRASCAESPTSKGTGNSEEDDEPTFTVAQLVSAYNKHQEIMTKNSLEVTIHKQRNYDNKMGEVFPTGPNALRLFIPDIQIRKSKPKQKKRMPRKKTGLPANPFVVEDLIEETVLENSTSTEEASSRGDENKRPLAEDKNNTTTLVDSSELQFDQLCLENQTNKIEDSVEQRLQPSRPDSLDLDDKCPEIISDRLGVTTPPPKYLRSETSPEPKQDKKKPPYYMSAFELKQQPMSNVAKTVELFNNYRPDRKSFCSPRCPVVLPEGTASGTTTDKTRRKSSPPTMKPF